MLTAERVRELLHYDPDTGVFTWRITRSNRRQKGAIAGSRSRTLGYIVIGIDGKNLLGHRLAWLYMTGNWPLNTVDHMNGDRADNRWSNLRDVPAQINKQNRRTAMQTNKSGVLGVIQREFGFQARITFNKKVHCLGTYATKEEAHSVYVQAKRKLHEGCTL